MAAVTTVPTTPSAPRHRAAGARRIPARAPVRAALLFTLPPALVVGSVLVGRAVELRAPLTEASRALHLLFLVVGLGAVLTVDFHGLRWLCGRGSLDDVLRLAGGTHLMVWAGYVGLAVTGSMLVPPALGTASLVKLAAVVVVGWNGAWFGLRQARPFDSPVPLLVSAALSQAGWWTAALIGFLNAHG